MTARGNVMRGYPPCEEPTGEREVRFPVGLQAHVSHSSGAPCVNTFLDLVAQKMVAQHHLT